MERILLRDSSNQTPRDAPPPPVNFSSAKLHSDGGRPSFGIIELSLDPGGSTVKQIPTSLQPREVPPTETILPSPLLCPYLFPEFYSARDQMVQTLPIPPPFLPALQPLHALPRTPLTAASRGSRVFDSSHLRLL